MISLVPGFATLNDIGLMQNFLFVGLLAELTEKDTTYVLRLIEELERSHCTLQYGLTTRKPTHQAFLHLRPRTRIRTRIHSLRWPKPHIHRRSAIFQHLPGEGSL